MVDCCLLSLFGVATSFRLRVLNNFHIFSDSGCFVIFVALSLSRSYQCVACPALVMNSCEVKAAPINAETIGIFPLSKQNTSGVLSLLAKRIFR